MKKSLISIITASAIVLAGCGSTTKTVNPDLVSNETPPAMPESYQTMIDFGIIDKYEANQVVNGQREALSNNLGEFRESALGQLTDGGDMFIGFAIAQLFGGGVALTDFFNPLAMFRSPKHQNHLKKSFFWVEVDDDCDEECGYQKIYDILTLAAQLYANNYIQLAKRMDKNNELNLGDGPATIKPLEVIEAKGSKQNIFFEKISKSYLTDIIELPAEYDALEKKRPFFTVWEADFTTVNGKRYFGSRVTTKELFTVNFHRIGQYSSWFYDNSQTFGLAKASETYPDFIYIETQNFVPQRSVEDRSQIITNAKAT